MCSAGKYLLISGLLLQGCTNACGTSAVMLLLQTRELSADQKAQLKEQAQKYESQLASNSADLEALEGAGVSYAQLGDFKRAETLIAKLTSARPTDPEAWRLLVGYFVLHTKMQWLHGMLLKHLTHYTILQVCSWRLFGYP